MVMKENSFKKESSSKFFTLILEEHHGDGLAEAKETKVPAKKGKSLFDCVQVVLENYGMSCESHSLFLGASNTPLPLHDNDAFEFREQTLYVRENEKSSIIPFRRNDSKKMSLNLGKRIDKFLKNFEISLALAEKVDTSANEFSLESSWKDVITEQDCMTNTKKSQQEAVWELLTSEVSYIKDLKVIIDVFLKCYKMLQYSGFLTEVDDKLIFANIEDIYDANVAFWVRLKLVLFNARFTREPISPRHLVTAFETFECLFLPYIDFCHAGTSNMVFPDFPASTNEMIRKFIEWCNNRKECKRLTISGFLIKPFQRVTKYSLLLKAIMKKTDDEEERSIVEKMVLRVEKFVSKINSAVHLRKEMEKMDNVISRLSEYYPIEGVTDESDRIIKEYCKFDLKANIPDLPEEECRFLLKEGQMKLIEKHGKKDVYVFLFSDILLITSRLKKNADKCRIIRQPFCLNRIVLHSLKDSGQLLIVYLNEYAVAASAVVLQVAASEHDEWKAAIEKTKGDLESILEEFNAHDDFCDNAVLEVSEPPIIRPPVIMENDVVRRRRTSNVLQPVCINNLFMRRGSRNILPLTLPDRELDTFNLPTCEWDSALTVAAVLIFVILNIFISQITG